MLAVFLIFFLRMTWNDQLISKKCCKDTNFEPQSPKLESDYGDL